MMYTVVGIYGATGEGQSEMALIGNFSSSEKAEARAKQVFGNYYAECMTVFEGALYDDPVVKTVVPEHTLAQLRKGGYGHAEVYGRRHFNYS